MDQAEDLARKYLESLFSTVDFEPDGNIPPDFVADGRIAVEVRRLNQNKSFGGNVKSLDEDSIPLYHNVAKLLETLGSPRDDASWFVMVQFSRPIPKWKPLRQKLTDELVKLMKRPLHGIVEIPISERFSVTVAKGSERYETHYCMGGASDGDSGGWLLSKLESNIDFCAGEKASKIAKHRGKYEEWWLVLVDQIAYAMNDLDRGRWDDKEVEMHGWNKIVLLDPLEKNSPFEI